MNINCNYTQWKALRTNLDTNAQTMYTALASGYNGYLVPNPLSNNFSIITKITESGDISDFDTNIKPTATQITSIG